jgi:hypothetical protein
MRSEFQTSGTYGRDCNRTLTLSRCRPVVVAFSIALGRKFVSYQTLWPMTAVSAAGAWNANLRGLNGLLQGILWNLGWHESKFITTAAKNKDKRHWILVSWIFYAEEYSPLLHSRIWWHNTFTRTQGFNSPDLTVLLTEILVYSFAVQKREPTSSVSPSRMLILLSAEYNGRCMYFNWLDLTTSSSYATFERRTFFLRSVGKTQYLER